MQCAGYGCDEAIHESCAGLKRMLSANKLPLLFYCRECLNADNSAKSFIEKSAELLRVTNDQQDEVRRLMDSFQLYLDRQHQALDTTAEAMGDIDKILEDRMDELIDKVMKKLTTMNHGEAEKTLAVEQTSTTSKSVAAAVIQAAVIQAAAIDAAATALAAAVAATTGAAIATTATSSQWCSCG